MSTENVNQGISGFALKAIIAGIVVFAGIGGGIYVGLAFSGNAAFSGQKPETLRNQTNMSIGDTFPNYALLDINTGEQTTISTLTKDGPVLLAFVSESCGACESMATYWRKRGIAEQLGDEIRVALIYDKDAFTDENSGNQILDIPNTTAFSANRIVQRDDDGIMATPSLVAIGSDGKIRFIITGFSRDLNADFIKEYMQRI